MNGMNGMTNGTMGSTGHVPWGWVFVLTDCPRASARIE